MTTTWTAGTKPSGSFINGTKPYGEEYMLKEDTDFLLLETGDRIVIARDNAYTNATKPS